MFAPPPSSSRDSSLQPCADTDTCCVLCAVLTTTLQMMKPLAPRYQVLVALRLENTRLRADMRAAASKVARATSWRVKMYANARFARTRTRIHAHVRARTRIYGGCAYHSTAHSHDVAHDVACLTSDSTRTASSSSKSTVSTVTLMFTQCIHMQQR